MVKLFGDLISQFLASVKSGALRLQVLVSRWISGRDEANPASRWQKKVYFKLVSMDYIMIAMKKFARAFSASSAAERSADRDVHISE